jgi:hypothetical protein
MFLVLIRVHPRLKSKRKSQLQLHTPVAGCLIASAEAEPASGRV